MIHFTHKVDSKGSSPMSLVPPTLLPVFVPMLPGLLPDPADAVATVCQHKEDYTVKKMRVAFALVAKCMCSVSP